MRNLIKLFVHCALLLSALFASVGSNAATVTYPLNLSNGWNLLGNSLSTPIDVKTSFGTQANVTTIWKWNAVTSTWAFYAPSLDAAGTLATYAAGKGYTVLSTIDPGVGYWVNANAVSIMGNQTGSGFALNAANLRAGWNLSATGDEVTPAAFSSIAGNVTTLWAWDNANNSWYFYAPSLSANNTLAGYNAGKGYKDFGALTLGSGRGFWVNSTGPVNVGPIANAGVDQNVVAGSTVTLDGSASTPSNGQVITGGVWTLTSQPALSSATLSSSTSPNPTFAPYVPGIYVVTLVVADGKASSAPSTVTITVSAAINPLPIGAGVFIQSNIPTNLAFYKASSYVLIQGKGCGSFIAADVSPLTGRVIGLSADGYGIYEIDPIGGGCRFLFSAPVAMKALAAYRNPSNGYININGYVTLIGTNNINYVITASGNIQASSRLSGFSNSVGVPDLDAIDGIAYSADGSLYGFINGALWDGLNNPPPRRVAE